MHRLDLFVTPPHLHCMQSGHDGKVCYIVLRACVVLHLMTRGQTKLGCQENEQKGVTWGAWVVGAWSKVEGLGQVLGRGW